MKDKFMGIKNFIIDTPQNYKDMENRFNKIHWGYKAFGVGVEIALLAACVGQKSPTVDTTKLFCLPKSNSNENSNRTVDERTTETLNSFIERHTEYKDRGATVINFSVNGINANTIAFVSTPEEKVEINSFKYQIEGETVTPYTDAIVWTLKTNPDCSEEWVRLAGVQYKTEKGDINTVWYYSPDAYNKDHKEAEFTKVLAFNSKAPEYVFYPLVIPPHAIIWNDDITVKKVGEPWDGIQPFVLPVGTIPEGPGKNGLLSLAQTETTSEEFTKVQEIIAQSENYTLNAKGEIEFQTEDGVVIIPGVKVSKENGAMTVTNEEGEIFEVDPKTIKFDGQTLTFIDNEGKTWVWDGNLLFNIPEYVQEINIVNEPLKWRSAPEVDPKDFPALAHVLMERFKNGELGEFPENSHFVPYLYNINGFKYQGITKALYPIVGNPNDLYGMDKRWYYLDSIFINKDTGSGVGHYFIIQKDGSAGQFFANFGPNPQKVGNGDIVEHIKGGADDAWFAPADFSEDLGCLNLLSDDQSYCDFYSKNRDHILKLYQEWAKTGFVPSEISRGEIIIALQGQHVKKP